MAEALQVLDLATAHTLAVIGVVAPAEAWDRLPGTGLMTLRDQLRHIALVRESILRCLAKVDTSGLGATFDTPSWRKGGTPELVAAFGEHADRCRCLLEGLRSRAGNSPFTTPFGNLSTPENYLRMLLLEETHHRAQMTMTLRLFGLTPPEYPGRAWVELGVDQGP